ncbi:MAG: hypothetical protein KME06_16360 [Kastovskya adunca ATA6-11-RM4]|jgi:hypothetical protein|nr:hypothetical protein [Kastovskya adunca ATA6-11-RM4]
MAFFRQYVAPFLVLLTFLVALFAVSARIFLPNDMAAPAPTAEMETVKGQTSSSGIDTQAGMPSVDAPTLPTSAGSLN